MADQSAIDAKKNQLKKSLERWALKKNVLGSGETLGFMLWVRSAPIVEEENGVEALLEMSPAEFFVTWRLRAVGAPKEIATRIQNVARNHSVDSNYGALRRDTKWYRTMREFLGDNNTVEDLTKLRNAGRRCAPYMFKALQEARLVDVV